MTDLTIAIATYNRLDQIQLLLAHLQPLFGECEIIVVDDGSGDGTSEFVSSLSYVRLFSNPKKMGTPFCWNLAIKEATNPCLLTIPDDVRIIGNQTDFARRIVEDLRFSEVVGVKVVDSSGPRRISKILSDLSYLLAGQVFPAQDDRPRFTSFVSGAMAFRKEIGSLGFDESYGGNAFREETDFQLRARRNGFRIFYDPLLRLDHLEIRRGGQYDGFNASERERWVRRNHRYFLKKNYSKSWWVKYPLFRAYRSMVLRIGSKAPDRT